MGKSQGWSEPCLCHELDESHEWETLTGIGGCEAGSRRKKRQPRYIADDRGDEEARVRQARFAHLHIMIWYGVSKLPAPIHQVALHASAEATGTN